MTPEEQKAALKEALKEWMDDKFAMFGKFSLGAFIVALLSIVAYALLTLNGWHKIP